MDNNSANIDLIRGHVTTIILKSLYDKDSYAYEILSEIETKSEGKYKIKQPTLYNSLKRLESQGYIKSYMGEISNGGKRRYYSLTEQGREFLIRDQKEWEYSRTILSRLLSDREFDLSNDAPFNEEDLRPYTRKATRRAPVQHEPEEEYTEDETVATVISQAAPPAPQPEADTAPEVHITEPVQPVEAHQKLLNKAADKDINYKSMLSPLFTRTELPVKKDKSKPVKIQETVSACQAGINELGDKLYSEGYRLIQYNKANVNIFYSMSTYFSNKLGIVAGYIIFGLVALTLCSIYLLFGDTLQIAPEIYIGILGAAIIIPVIPTIRYLTNPNKRIKAKFDLRLTIMSRLIIYLNLVVIVTLLAFFLFGANINDSISLARFIYFPIVLLLNVPFSSFVYWILYSSKKFHLK